MLGADEVDERSNGSPVGCVRKLGDCVGPEETEDSEVGVAVRVVSPLAP